MRKSGMPGRGIDVLRRPGCFTALLTAETPACRPATQHGCNSTWPRTASLKTLGLSIVGGVGSVRARFLDVAAILLETTLCRARSSAAAQRWRAFVQGWANVIRGLLRTRKAS